MGLQVAGKSPKKGKNLYALRPLELLNSHSYALDFSS
jgi:hypothetical protein